MPALAVLEAAQVSAAVVLGYPYTVLLAEASCLVTGVNLNSVFFTPTIYMGYTGTAGENLLYHEFGHFVMWHLNNKKWTDVKTGSFSQHDGDDESNIRIAWNEGWADAFSLMVDARYRNIDEEFHFFGGDYENRVLDDIGDINFGVGSEFFIACALYDLWDGPIKLTGEPADQYNDVNANPPLEDPNRWRNGEFDDVELSFTEIANAIRYGTIDETYSNDVNVVSSVQSFFYNLIRNKSCEEAKKIKKEFDQNRVVGIVSNFPDGNYKGFSSDNILTWDYIQNNAGDGFNFFFKHDLNVLENPVSLFNLGFSLSNLEYANISDPLQVNNGSSLYFNAVGTPFLVDDNGTPDDEMLYATVCTAITNSGLIHVGHDGNNPAHRNVAEVKFVSDGSLTLNAGSTLRVKPHSRVIFESGSSFTYNGGDIILEGDDSYIDIRGNFHIGDNATFTFTGKGHILVSTPWGGPSFTSGNNSRFILNGSGKSDLVLVTNGWMIQPSDNLEEFNVTNGKVECDQYGGLNLGCACTIDNVLITRRADLTTLYPHSGLNIYDQNDQNGNSTANINDVEIEHGWRGFVSIPWSVVPSVSNLYVHNCKEPFLTINAGISMQDVHLENNQTGWLALNMSLPSSADDLHVEQSGAFGVSYDGTSTSPLYLSGPSIHNNGFVTQEPGLLFTGNMDCNIRCGGVFNNTADGIVAATQSRLIMTAGEAGVTGNGGTGIKPYFAKDLLLSGGENSFAGNNGTTGHSFQINGVVSNPAYCSTLTLVADNNQWLTGSSSYAPQYGIDYHIVFM